jgi:hypothetical protein
MTKKLFILLAFTSFMFSGFPGFTQEGEKREAALNLYIDCDYCDMVYFRQEFTLVNYVRDRMVADVQMIVTTMSNGGGGEEYTLQFIGLKRFADCSDTIVINTAADATSDEIRAQLLEAMKRGLASYIMKTSYSDRVIITYENSDNEEDAKDPWNNWVFRTNFSAWMDGERTSKSLNVFSSLSASRITEKIKHLTRFHQDYDEDKYRIYNENDSLIYSFDAYRSSFYAGHTTVWSLGDHWGLGVEGNIWSSTYSNTRIAYDAMPALEYNVFKYEDASNQQLRLAYAAGYSYYYYQDTTIYNQIEEGLFYHKVNVNYKYITKWGSIQGSIWYKNFLKDFQLYNLGSFLSTNIRLFKGFSVYLTGDFSMPRNQITLVKANISPEDLLTEQIQLQTQFSYSASIGFTYTFGSIYNNVVNPRLD